MNPAILRRRRWGGNPLAAYAAGGVSPVLVADFAESKYLGQIASFNDLTFARASTATYIDADSVLQTASSNVARFDYLTGARRLLIEPTAATNLATYSADLGNAAWGRTSISIGSETSGGPSGTYRTITPSASAAGPSQIFQIGKTVASGSRYSGWAIVKYSSGNGWFVVNVYDTTDGDERAWFDIQSGVKGSADALIADYDILSLGDGWYLCWATKDASSTSGGISFEPTTADSTVARNVGDAVFYAVGQYELGSVFSSYIPTSGTTATRAAETITFDLDAGTYDIRVVTEDGTTDLTSVVHGGGAYWPTDAAGRVAQVIVYPEGALT